ncbi:hypothetical protein WN53_18175 [Serratia fonticola]|uniref:hypothetical protein n=1 Tax=Serratia fonticola TaxID=47917 RepID=UPI000465C48C|nr:hypothetical protein [Serratia fonticola]AKG70896.1 hypothetical protein WN53_18175 [Serratia fonticola]CAI1689111.1 Uncharacterised protein [Serratia fonticola]
MINKINGSVTKNIKIAPPPKKKTILDVFFHRKVKNVSNSSINLHPKGIGKGYEKYQAFSRETIGNVNAIIGYVSNFRNSGEEAVLIHGTKNGRVTLHSHFVDNRKEFSVKDFISHIKKVHNIDISEKKGPLHVMSCFGVTNGVYQAFSDELRREVIGYGDGNAISTSGNLKNHFNKETSIIKSVSGDVEKDQPDDLKLTKASIHKYIPQPPKN